MANVYSGKFCGIDYVLSPVENLIYRCCGIDAKQEMNWKDYLKSMLIFNLFGIIFLYLIQRLQVFLPLNPEHFSNIKPDLAFNAAVSFVTNTDWQAYAGESSMSYFTQMFGFTVQNFLSAATGMSLLIALIRGLKGRETSNLGNFWVDLIRSVLYILLPLSLLFAVILMSQGVIQNFHSYQKVRLLQPVYYQHSPPAITTVSDAENQHYSAAIPKIQIAQLTDQILPMGPVASQIAIKQLGTNGGGFFNTNAAHPFENPTPFSNFIEMLELLLIPASLCYTFGILVNDNRQGRALLITMFIIFIPFMSMNVVAEQQGNPALTPMQIQQSPIANYYPGGNMEGKETRFGIVASALWASATTAASNGSVNAMLDSFTPLGGLVPLWLMHLGEIVFGGVGSGLYGMIMLVIITVFISGLMVGRTPEYLGKKIEPFEMKMAVVAVLIMPLIVLFFTAIGVVSTVGKASILNAGTHGFTEILYAFTSMANNNGSAFAGLNGNTSFYTILGGIAILIGRFWIAIPMLAIAGSLVGKKIIPTSPGTLKTHTPLFIGMLVGTILIIGALSFFPALSLGPIVEHLMLWSQYGR